MKKLRNLLALMLAVLVLMIPMTALAEGEVDSDGVGEGEMIGTIQPLQVRSVLPTVVTFTIDPNEAANYTDVSGGGFISPTFQFQNTSGAPLKFSVQSITEQTDNPAVVNQDAFTDEQWKVLTKEQTRANIAFGFVGETSTEWIGETVPSLWYATATGADIGTVPGNSSADLHLKCKYGLLWGNTDTETITYDVVYKVAAE